MNTPMELDVFNCSLEGVQLIEASAGTGKTWNICGLYLRMLLEQRRSVREILVVTFTNAATAELRDRIRSRLLDLSRALDPNTGAGGDAFVVRFIASVLDSGRIDRVEAGERLNLALLSFDEAAIFTIHGFCQRALADTPFAAALPFRFELVPDDREIKREVATDYWRKHVVHGDLDRDFTAYLLDTGCGPDWLSESLEIHLRRPLARLIWPDFQGLENATDHGEGLRRTFRDAGDLWQRESEAAVDAILRSLSQLNGVTYKESAILSAAGQWNDYFTRAEPLAEIGDKQHLLSTGTLQARTKKNGTAPRHDFFQQAQTLLELHGRLRERLQLQRLRLLRDWLTTAPGELAARKQARRMVSFDDLLGKLHDALAGGSYPWLASTIRQRFPCALIDEFQDTDPLQFGIFRRIYGQSETPAPLFLVGDPKQAIYSFRSADLHTYLEARSGAAQLHTLSANQRSSPGLIHACNALFGVNARGFVLDGLSYHPVRYGDKPRPAFSDTTEPRRDLELWSLPLDEAGMPRPKSELRALVATTCAAEVARLLNAAGAESITVAGQPLRASDIAIVVRSHAQGSRIKKALAELGISSVELSQQSIFQTEQAEEVERVLLAIVDPSHIGLLKGALTTELMGQDGASLWRLNEDEGCLASWAEAFQSYRRIWLEQGFAMMWQTLLRERHTALRVLGSPGGDRKLTNLMHLGELLAGATDPRTGLETLLRWLAGKRSDDGMDEIAQLRLESDENLVQILTIHKSKGLEYPIVFCPYLWEGNTGSRRRNSEVMSYHRDGTAVLDFSLEDEVRREGKIAADLEEAAEQIRLIYVALTRAVHRCYLVVGNYATVHGKSTSFKESGHSALNWLVAGAGTDFGGWLAGNTDPAAVTAAWNRLAESAPGLRLSTLPHIPAAGLRTRPEAREDFKARRMTRHPVESWRLGSFSSLSRGTVPETPVPDRDTLIGEVVVPETMDADRVIPPGDILLFPRGEKAGLCLHRAFELADFTDTASWPQAIAQALEEYPQPSPELSPEDLTAMMRSLLADVLATPLSEGLSLDSVPRRRRLTELEFCFPIGHLTPRTLARWLECHGYPHPNLGFLPFSGFLKGFIDLVFEHAGRYYLLDWKSNHLGMNPGDYAQIGLRQAINQHGYHLQYLCYALALHRYLGLRLPDYRYENHFGGCLYLFVRAVRPHWCIPDGTPRGVFFHRPELAVIEDLDRLFSPPVAVANR